MLKLVQFKKDPAVIKICESWCGDYDSSTFVKMGFEVDDQKTGYSDAVQDFKEELQSQKK